MDPLSQGLVGALVAQAVARRSELRLATLAGFGAGLLADMDVLIRSEADPLLFLEYHRHFTHALVFIPLGGLLAALLLWPLLRRRLGFGRLLLYTTLGYATHGLLDACTTYGTQLLWPFTDLRVAWHLIAVIDPLFTLPLLALMLLALVRRQAALSMVAIGLGLGYLALGALQRERADHLLAQVAAAEGHRIERGGAKPTLGNLLVWRGVYADQDQLYAVALRPGLFGPDQAGVVAQTPRWRQPGAAELDPDSVLAGDIERFRHFSLDWLSQVPGQPDLVGDFRYALLPDRAAPLWAIRVDPERPDRHADYVVLRDVAPGDIGRFWCMIVGGCLPTLAER